MRLISRPIAVSVPGSLHPAEAACLPAAAVDRRKLEFAAGRACASAAMASFGIEAEPVLVAPDRSPVWPAAFVGSISHSGSLAAAAVALRSSGIRAVGLDIEEAVPLDAELHAEICVDRELAWLDRQPAGNRGLLAKAIFCAKEAAYKCQYPITRRLFGFDVFRVTLDAENHAFTAHFLEDVAPFARSDSLAGHLWFSGGHIVAALALR